MTATFTGRMTCLVLFLFAKFCRADSSHSFLRSEEMYLHALVQSDTQTFLKDFEYPFLCIVRDSERATYESIESVDERKHYMMTYWRAVDPNPLLDENDALTDFRKRFAHVRQNFSMYKPPYFDDRGKYWLRYGEPFRRFTDPGGPKFLWIYDIAEWEAGIGGVEARRHISIREREWYTTFPNETWNYEWSGKKGDQEELIVHFVKANTYKEVGSLDDMYLDTRDSGVRTQCWMDIFKSRALYLASDYMTKTLDEISDIEEEIEEAREDHEFGNATLGGDPLKRMKRSFRIMNHKKRLMEKYVEQERAGIVNTIFEYDRAVGSLSLIDDVTQFRNADGGTDVAVTLYSPFMDFYDDASVEVAGQLEIGYSCLLRDRMFTPVVQTSSMTGTNVSQSLRSGFTHGVGNLRFTAIPQEADLTMQVEEKTSDRRGFSRRPFEVKDFSGGSLMLSDVRFFALVEEAAETEYLPVLDVLDMSVTPYPYPEIREETPVMCYFEIYNLITSGVVDAYEVAMRVTRDNSRRGVLVRFARLVGGHSDESVSVSHTQPVTQDMEQELLGVDFSKLDPGVYVLEVTVRGKDQPYLSASIRKPIIITD